MAVPIEENIAIPVGGSRLLSARLWRPAGEGRWPAILDASPYRAGDIFRLAVEAQLPALAANGYAALAIDIAGSGNSPGILADEYETQEVDDLVAAIAFVAEQEWCDGSVGLSGFSWSAFAALRAGAKRPPALKAMVLGGVSEDGWRTDIHYLGGVAYTAQVDWAGVMLMFNALPPDPAQFAGDWRAEWKNRLAATEPFLLRWLSHPAHDDYWTNKSVDLARSPGVPLLLYAGLADKYAISVLRIAEEWPGPVRTLVGPWEHASPQGAARGPRIGFLQEALRWWDTFLKGKDRGALNEAPLRLWLASPDAQGLLENGAWIHSPWPYETGRQTRYVLKDALLSRGTAASEACVVLVPARANPPTLGRDLYEDAPASFDSGQAQSQGAFVVFSEPFEEALEIGLSPRLTCRTNAHEGTLVARILDVAPDGVAVRMTTGAVNLAQCEGEEIVIRFQAAAWRLEKGHRLGLVLSADGWPTFWLARCGEPLTVTALALDLPEAERLGGTPLFSAPEEAPSGGLEALKWLDPARELLPPPAKDVVSFAGAPSAFHLTATGTDYLVASRFDVAPRPGNEAHAVKCFHVAFQRPDWSVRVDTKLEVTSTPHAFRIAWKIDARENGVCVYLTEQETSVPRTIV